MIGLNLLIYTHLTHDFTSHLELVDEVNVMLCRLVVFFVVLWRRFPLRRCYLLLHREHCYLYFDADK